ncbi:hypothetical protein HKCCE3408_00260 [Rhodobacterales bacterium HKCCE3408]|nr:hypothetical protein [Rhodobacterales bacterium HKCCE3408]
MPIAFSTCLERDLLYARWTGIVTVAEFIANFADYLADKYYRPGRPELIDLSRLTDFTGDFNEIRAMLRIVNTQAPEQVVDTLTIIWAPSNSIYGITRIYQQLAELAGGIRVEIHRDEAPALAALDLPHETVDDLLAEETFHPQERRV